MLVEAIGDVGGVGVLGACEVSDGFAWGGEGFGGGELVVGLFGFGACGVEGRGVDELLEVVYWMCVVALPIGLPYLAMCDDCRSADRDTRWVFCFSEGVGVGMFKMADFRPLSHAVGEGLGVRATKTPREAACASANNCARCRDFVPNHAPKHCPIMQVREAISSTPLQAGRRILGHARCAWRGRARHPLRRPVSRGESRADRSPRRNSQRRARAGS